MPGSAIRLSVSEEFSSQFAKVAEFLIDFPVLISLSPPQSDELATIANGGRIYSNNGYDIIFTDANYNKLDHQVESYDPVTGALVAWVRLPILSNAVNTTVRILYSNDQVITNPSVETVWRSDYKGVWHLNGTDYTDATSTGNDGTNNNTWSVTGRIAGGRGFNGSNSYIRMNPLSGFNPCNGTQTISIWARYSAVPPAHCEFYSISEFSSAPVRFRLDLLVVCL